MSILEWENVIKQQIFPIKIITSYIKSISVNSNYIYIIKSSRNDINIIKLSNGRIFLEFIKEEWKYSNFINCQIIYLEINKKIYKLCPNMVKSNMIDVDIPVKKKVFINNLINGKFDNSLSLPNQCNLYIKQQGAGNGKTFGIIQRLVSKEFSHYESIIIVTKQHSAKYVIYNELQSQIEKKQLDINILNHYNNKKKYIIEFKNNNNTNCKLVIATVDSFIWTLGDKNNKGYDIFITKLYSIINDYLPQNCTYVGDIELNKKLCLVCDETQDLSILYAKALIRIMRNKYIDLYVVGDKLQSLQFIDNAFTYLYDNEFPYITKYKETPVNICRRFNSLDLINFVNNTIPFERYNLPKIQIDNNENYNKNSEENNNNESSNDNDNNNIKIFYGESIYNNDLKVNINTEIDEIMKKYIYEVENNNYKPNDFLIITPFTNKNILMNTLEIAINMFWIEKYDDKNKYKRYAIFHKSEVGNSINLDESINATRMVSIHSSKGDGRNVVFLIGFTENALNKFSGESNNLIYDSLIHVAFTRMKKRIYIRLEKNKFDRFYTLIGKNSNLPYQRIEYLDISKYINIKNIKNYTQNQATYELLYDIISFESEKLSDDTKNNTLIDMNNHNIRYAIMNICFNIRTLLNLMGKNDESIKKEILHKFSGIIRKSVTICDSWKDYLNELTFVNYNIKSLCILRISKNAYYSKYFEIIYRTTKNVVYKLKCILDYYKSNNNSNIKLTDKLINMCPYEYVILYYLKSIYENGKFTEITITDIYNLTDIYYKCFNKTIGGHEYCSCEKFFNNKKIDVNYQYLILDHFEQINKIDYIYFSFLRENKNVNWLSNYLLYNNDDNNYGIINKYNIIGYDDAKVYVIYLHPTLTEINKNEIILNCLLDTFSLIYFNNKNIIKDKIIECYLFSFNKKNYIKLDWDNNKLIKDNYEKIIKIIRLSTFDIYSANFNKIYMYYIDNIEKIRSYNFNLTNLQIITKVKEDYLSMIQKLKMIKNKNDFNNVHFIEKTLDYIEKLVKTSNIDPLIEECKFYNIMYDIFNSDIKNFLV